MTSYELRISIYYHPYFKAVVCLLERNVIETSVCYRAL